jgi:hypothetical protein
MFSTNAANNKATNQHFTLLLMSTLLPKKRKPLAATVAMWPLSASSTWLSVYERTAAERDGSTLKAAMLACRIYDVIDTGQTVSGHGANIVFVRYVSRQVDYISRRVD